MGKTSRATGLTLKKQFRPWAICVCGLRHPLCFRWKRCPRNLRAGCRRFLPSTDLRAVNCVWGRASAGFLTGRPLLWTERQPPMLLAVSGVARAVRRGAGHKAVRGLFFSAPPRCPKGKNLASPCAKARPPRIPAIWGWTLQKKGPMNTDLYQWGSPRRETWLTKRSNVRKNWPVAVIVALSA